MFTTKLELSPVIQGMLEAIDALRADPQTNAHRYSELIEREPRSPEDEALQAAWTEREITDEERDLWHTNYQRFLAAESQTLGDETAHAID